MLDITIQTQPDDETCGATCLDAVYQYYGFKFDLTYIIETLHTIKTGGTLVAHLGKHALEHDLKTTVYVYNLNLFDPSWFHPRTGEADNDFLIEKLSTQLKYFKSNRDIEASHAYIDMLAKGGKLKFRDLNGRLLKELFDLKIPIVTGLSSTFLYHTSREVFNSKTGKSSYDDLRGEPCGHFVVLCGMDSSNRQVVVADPFRKNPISHDNYYKVNKMRLINAILLGVLTYDANLLIIEK